MQPQGPDGPGAGGHVAEMRRIHEAAAREPVSPEHVQAAEPAIESANVRSVDTITLKPDWSAIEPEMVVEQVEPEKVIEQQESHLEPGSEQRSRKTYEDFKARFEDIHHELGRHKHPKDALDSAKVAYVEEETESYQLQKFSKLILAAPTARRREKQLDHWRTAGRRLHHEQEHMRESTRIVCAYNQLLGSFIQSNEDEVPRRQLEQWLKQSANGDSYWAERLVSGIAAEVAAEKLLQGVVENVMHGDLDQDLTGQDLIFDETAAGYGSIDVKSRKHGAVLPVELGKKGQMTLYIDPEHMDREGYQVLPEFAEQYKDALRRVLVEGEVLDPRSKLAS